MERYFDLTRFFYKNEIQSDCKYKAFISYSQKDLEFALKFHRNLEGYRIPNSVIRNLKERDQQIGKRI
jgi:hypothetical protein